jgi:hypothetical protein
MWYEMHFHVFDLFRVVLPPMLVVVFFNVFGRISPAFLCRHKSRLNNTPLDQTTISISE